MYFLIPLIFAVFGGFLAYLLQILGTFQLLSGRHS
jgi:hypothetical protein